MLLHFQKITDCIIRPLPVISDPIEKKVLRLPDKKSLLLFMHFYSFRAGFLYSVQRIRTSDTLNIDEVAEREMKISSEK